MAKTTIYVLNGPNMNLLGTREPEKYGRATLADVEKLCARRPPSGSASISSSDNRTGKANWSTGFRRRTRKMPAASLSIAAGYTTTSIAILDALLAVKLPVIEVHITNIHARESFRHNSYISKAAKAVIAGFGIDGYALAITGLAGLLGARQKG